MIIYIYIYLEMISTQSWTISNPLCQYLRNCNHAETHIDHQNLLEKSVNLLIPSARTSLETLLQIQRI